VTAERKAAAVRPFRIDIAQSDLEDLADRLDRTRFVPEIPGSNDFGVAARRVRPLVECWRNRYDWRAWEALINIHPQFVTRIDGLDVHFLHVRSPAPNAFPLLLTHGWPMSIVEYLSVIGPLTDPPAHGRVGQAFDVVIPSIPGFGFSGPVLEPDWNRHRVARAWAQLMDRLGYFRYGVHGNDVGAIISIEVGRVDPDRVAGVHVTQVFSLPSSDRRELAAMDDDDRDRVRRSEWFIRNKGAYLQLQSTQPQTLAHALGDSPVGQLAWNLQLFGDDVTDDYVITNVMIYWLTNTAGTSAVTAYFEPGQAPRSPELTTTPLGVATFADDVFQSVRPLAERDHGAITSWNVYGTGGHHAAHTVPGVLVDDIRRFFRPLLEGTSDDTSSSNGLASAPAAS